jgi:hypothetical protein
MAAIAVRTLTNSGDPAISVEESKVQDTQMASTTITAGVAVKYDSNGRWALAAATGAVDGIATHNAVAGEGLTAIREGVLDGYNLDALAYGANAFAGASGVVDTAGTVVVGRVIPARSHLRGNAPDKLLYVNCAIA